MFGIEVTLVYATQHLNWNNKNMIWKCEVQEKGMFVLPFRIILSDGNFCIMTIDTKILKSSLKTKKKP